MIDRYLSQILQPALLGQGISPTQVQVVAQDVRLRLTALARHVSHRPFRIEPLLVLGTEEGQFYEPRLSADRAALVVVGIRNSQLENLHTTQSANPRLAGKQLDDAAMRAITGDAVAFWSNHPLMDEAASLIDNESATVFSGFAAAYPTAWGALRAVADLTGSKHKREARFDTPRTKHPGLDWLGPVDHAPSPFTRETTGFTLGVPRGLHATLALMEAQSGTLFFVDSFKMLSRNPEVVLKVMEFLLASGKTFVTHNYLFRKGYAARRRLLLRPAHSLSDTLPKFADDNDLCRTHLTALRQVKRSLPPSSTTKNDL